jgi:hypothetical protein
MKDLLAIVPTRGRPESVQRFADAFYANSDGNADLVFGIDEDDTTVYPEGLTYDKNPRARFSGTLNNVTKNYPGYFAYFAAGDDHLIETQGFDTVILDKLNELGTGFVYGADGLMNEFLPTAGAMTGNVIETLGYMSLPELIHLYVDNWWKDLFSAVGKLAYVSDLKISHLHPSGGFTAWDDQYKEVNDPAMYEHDRTAYEAYLSTRFASDIEKIRGLL